MQELQKQMTAHHAGDPAAPGSAQPSLEKTYISKFNSQREEERAQIERSLSSLLTGIPSGMSLSSGEIGRLDPDDSPKTQGTYGYTWEGMWMETEKVALKALRYVTPESSEQIKQRMARFDKIRHPNLFHIYGITVKWDQILIVSPWQDNGNILQYVKNRPATNRVHLLSGAAEGVAYLHENNVVLGNLRCTNILIGADGEPRVCDFGLAAVVAAATETPVPLALIVEGPLPWLAPEIIAVSSSSSTPADTYAFAVTIVELCHGGLPPDFAVASQEHTLPLRASGLTKPLWGMVQRCWSSDPRERPSMDDVTLWLMSIDPTRDPPPGPLLPSDQPHTIHPQDPPLSPSVSALEPDSSMQNLSGSSDARIPECAPEPLSLWIDLHPLSEVHQIPEHAPEPVSQWANLNAIG
ncbi:hypothetical protein HWV62_38314 [Athelia sp. TMB]|nr:hypothetical protein HWV62_38314 [Athelia sp. TMB]